MANNYYMAARARFDKATKRRGIPIYLRFSYKGDAAWLATGVYIKKKEYWNDDLKLVVDGPNRRSKNNVINKKFDEAEERIDLAIASGDGPNSKAFKGTTLENFEDYIKEVDKSESVKGTLKWLREFHGGIPFIGQVNVKFLRRLEDFMWENKLAPQSVKNYMAVLSKVLNQAHKEGFIAKSPFGKNLYVIPKPGKTIPTFLVESERKKALDYFLNKADEFSPDTYRVLAYFLLGCYSGLRYSDWDVFDYDFKVQGDVLVLLTQKTGGMVTYPIQKGSALEDILRIIRVLGPLNMPYTTVCDHLDRIEKILKFKKILTTHVGRHSFGYYCGSNGITETATAYWMGITVAMVKVYYHVSGKHMMEQAKLLPAA